ncbi:hypothetical protein ONZ51_g12136 [Trametes cubensis]|uniref:Uncharacterized protein n=1 Tax=Trametes cubensis TaxID=1111947 RepID=A0AAD7TGB2_9APHY|nr:hypothetical protein ONZ51_g12136 [Trametes cubensis]
MARHPSPTSQPRWANAQSAAAKPPTCTSPKVHLNEEQMQQLASLMRSRFKWDSNPRFLHLEGVRAQLEGVNMIIQAPTGAGKTAVAAGPHVWPMSTGKITLWCATCRLSLVQVDTFKKDFGLRAVAVNSAGTLTHKVVTVRSQPFQTHRDWTAYTSPSLYELASIRRIPTLTLTSSFPHASPLLHNNETHLSRAANLFGRSTRQCPRNITKPPCTPSAIIHRHHQAFPETELNIKAPRHLLQQHRRPVSECWYVRMQQEWYALLEARPYYMLTYSQGCNVPDVDLVIQWKLPKTFSNFVQHAGRAARSRNCNGMAVLLVERSAYSVDLCLAVTPSDPTHPDGHGKGKGHAASTKATARSKALPKDYVSRSGTSKLDTVPEHSDEPVYGWRYLRAKASRFYLELHVATSVIPPFSTVPILAPVLHLRNLECLLKWRRDVFTRDHAHSQLDPSAILDQSTINALTTLGGLSPIQVAAVLCDTWIWWPRYGAELTMFVMSLTIVYRPLPKAMKSQTSKGTPTASSSVPTPATGAGATNLKRAAELESTCEQLFLIRLPTVELYTPRRVIIKHHGLLKQASLCLPAYCTNAIARMLWCRVHATTIHAAAVLHAPVTCVLHAPATRVLLAITARTPRISSTCPALTTPPIISMHAALAAGASVADVRTASIADATPNTLITDVLAAPATSVLAAPVAGVSAALITSVLTASIPELLTTPIAGISTAPAAHPARLSDTYPTVPSISCYAKSFVAYADVCVVCCTGVPAINTVLMSYPTCITAILCAVAVAGPSAHPLSCSARPGRSGYGRPLALRGFL